MNRHNARERALQVLFQEDFRETSFVHPQWFGTDEEISDPFSRKLVEGVFLHHVEIDRLMRGKAEHWSCERMTPIDKNILRIAVFELLFLKETPPRVVLNEAIEVAKKYGTENSGAFVNGVLDAIAMERRPMGSCTQECEKS